MSLKAIDAQLRNPVGIFVSSKSGNGFGGFSGDNGPATSAQLNGPTCVFVSSNNEVYIADCQNYRIRKILQNGDITTIAGNGINGFRGDNGIATSAEFSDVFGLFVSENNEVYFSDTSNNRIRKILQNGIIITIAGNGTNGFDGDNRPATSVRLNNPTGVYVSESNEIYFADHNNHRIRKILQNGNIITIAGNGNNGFSDNIPATSAQFNSPFGVFISNNEVYISDFKNHRIRKILQTGIIKTIAGNGIGGFSGDNGPATSAQLNYPYGIFVSENNEVFIADYNNNRIRKILENGNITTIAGDGIYGFRGSPFNFFLHPHIGNNHSLGSKMLFPCLKKHSRDELFGLQIYGFMPLIEKMSTQFSQILKKEKILCSMNPVQLSHVQKLIGSLIYDKTVLSFNKNETLDVILILGLFKNREFIDLKRVLTREFVNTLTLTEFPSQWEKIESMLTTCKEFGIENYILDCLNNYCIEYAAVNLKTTEGNTILPTVPIIIRNSTIFSKLILNQPPAISIDEIVEIQQESIESLFNDMKTSDVKIKMGEDKYLYCHKTILSSVSTFFSALLESGSSFSDLNDGVFTPDDSEDLDLLEIVIKYCYGISFDKIDTTKTIGLLDMAMKHEIAYLVEYCKNNLPLSIHNYFDIVSACENYFDLPLFEGFFNEIIRFGIANRKQLFTDLNAISKLPEKVCKVLLLHWSQN